MAQTHDHETVSIYPFTDEEVDQLLNHSAECVLMWSTKDGWPVGVTHAYVWHEGRIWLTFASHRHRASARTAYDYVRAAAAKTGACDPERFGEVVVGQSRIGNVVPVVRQVSRLHSAGHARPAVEEKNSHSRSLPLAWAARSRQLVRGMSFGSGGRKR